MSLVEITKTDFWVMFMSTIRYSLGRGSYMPGVCAELYSKHKDMLPPPHKKQIAYEIREFLRMNFEFNKKVPDHETWISLALAAEHDAEEKKENQSP